MRFQRMGRTTVMAVALGVAALSSSLLASTASAASTSSATPVHASAGEVAQLLFVAGDVGRLSQVPSGTEAVVLEKVLQQLYLEQPSLSPAQAVSDVQSLQAVLSSGAQAISPATLTVMAGNERVLAIIRALTDSNPPADVLRAVSQVAAQALTDASDSTQDLQQPFDVSVDSLDTLTFSSFSPAGTLARSASLAATNPSFGQARDQLWKQASHESIFDGSQALIAEDPALQNPAIQSFMSLVAPDGSLTTTVAQLESLIGGGVHQIDNQNCAVAPGASGTSPADCDSGALHDTQVVGQQCGNGNSGTQACQDARSQVQANTPAEVNTIASEQAATTAEADALGFADQQLGQVQLAEAQAAAQVADEENQYLNYVSDSGLEKAGSDVAILAVTLSLSEVDPVAALTGVLNFVGDTVGYTSQNPNQIILQSLQNVSQQISDFEQYTQTAFHALDTRLADLSSEVASDTAQLSVQLTQLSDQVRGVATQLTTLQGSVDRLQSEVQTLFASGAKNDLNSLISQNLGYWRRSGRNLDSMPFDDAAAALYNDATKTAITSPVVLAPSNFDALSANNNVLVTGADPLSLDSNINYFNSFGAKVTDSPPTIGWPGRVSTSCAANSDPTAGVCLPDPDFWATSARAYAQLLSENPQYVTQTYRDWLVALEDEGQQIANALHQLASNNAGGDPTGTGNQTLDAAVQYYQYWGQGTHSSGPPSLQQAVENVEHSYLSTTQVPNLVTASGGTIPYVGVNPWGGPTQTPDYGELLSTKAFTTVPLCSSEAHDGQNVNLNPNDYLLPYGLTQSMIDFLPEQVVNAARLGIGQLTPCFTAAFGFGLSATGGPFQMDLVFNYSGGGVNEQVGDLEYTSTFASYCPGTLDNGQSEFAAINVVVNGCGDTQTWLSGAQLRTPTYPSDVAHFAEPAVRRALKALQAGMYEDVISNGSTLTTGTGPATNVEDAASRLGGANALLDGYVSLGLPQSLASDDTLHSLVSGQNEDAFAMTGTAYNPWGATPATDVPTQVVNYYQAALNVMPDFDPATFLGSLVNLRGTLLANALRAHIVPGAGGSSARSASRLALPSQLDAQSNSTALAEDNALIGPTLDRLDETHTALVDTATNGATLYVAVDGPGTVSGSGIACPGACSENYAPGTIVTLTPTAPSGSTFAGWSGACSGTGPCKLPMNFDQDVTATFVSSGAGTPSGPSGSSGASGANSGGPAAHTPAPKCTVKPAGGKVPLVKPKKRGSKVKPGTLSVTVKCNQAAKVRLSLTLTRPVGKKPKHGKQRTITTTVRGISASVKAGRVKVFVVKLPQSVLKLLGAKVTESGVFQLTAVNGNGTTHATARLASVKRA